MSERLNPIQAEQTHATGYAVGCPDWREAIRKVEDCAKRTGYTTELVNREGSVVVTINSRYGDRVLARVAGRNGIYTK